MAIQNNITIDVNHRELIKSMGSRGRRDDTWMVQPAREAIKRAACLIDPVIVYSWVKVVAIESEKVRVHKQKNLCETALHVGPYADLMAAASIALISINSIGHQVDEAVGLLNQQGNALEAYFLDCVGVLALSKVGDAANRMAEKMARKAGWGVSARLSPGSLKGWDVVRQNEVYNLLDLEDSGISLSTSGLLQPFKSASGMIGIGPGFTKKKVGTTCHLCNLQDSCWRCKH